MAYAIILLYLLFGLAFLIALSYYFSPKILDLEGKHVIITGGSSGIGKAVAAICLRKGAKVCLFARNQKRLDEAKEDLQNSISNADDTTLKTFAVDVAGDEEKLVSAVEKAEQAMGACDVLICSAGVSVARTFLDTSSTEFKRVMDINLMGVVASCRAVLPGMVQRRRGRIAIVSSMGGQIGIYGYTAYSTSKFALRGFAETLQMEVKHLGVLVSLVVPPDTDTPMLHEECKERPIATNKIAGAAGLWQPERVAEALVYDIQRGRFLTWLGIDGLMLTTVTSGAAPPNSLLQALCQILTIAPFRLVAILYSLYFYRVIKKWEQPKSKQE